MAAPKYQPLTLSPINFSLTEGTSIPAPPDSPPDTPRPPTPGKGPLSSHPTPKSSVFPQHRDSPPPKNSSDSAGEAQLHQTNTNDDHNRSLSPSSPTGKRPSSVRKFLGFRPMSSSDSLKSDRPGSPSTVASQPPSLQRKKSGSWFGKRKSTFGMSQLPEGKENQTPPANGNHATARAAPPPQKKGPPPPALPELKAFGASQEAFSFEADDMFKNIK